MNKAPPRVWAAPLILLNVCHKNSDILYLISVSLYFDACCGTLCEFMTFPRY